MGDFYFNSEEVRSIIHNAHKIKKLNKCHQCNGTGYENWNGDTGGDVKPGPLGSYDGVRCEGECENCDGLGYVDILIYE